jgi:hypothetical protein
MRSTEWRKKILQRYPGLEPDDDAVQEYGLRSRDYDEVLDGHFSRKKFDNVTGV